MKKLVVLALAVMFMVALGGFWSASGTTQTGEKVPRTVQSGDGAPDQGSEYVVRPHPRGLPRRGTQVRRDAG